MLNVMIVDDQATSRIILEEVVSALGADVRVHAFATPYEALAFADGHAPDLVVSDYRMPGLDGIALLARLRALPDCADVPVVLVTLSDDRALRCRALEAGAIDVLTKPVDLSECRARCRNLLALRRQQRVLADRARRLEARAEAASLGLAVRERAALETLARAVALATGRTAGPQQDLAQQMCEHLGLLPEECTGIATAAGLYDIGMLAVPEAIRDQAGPLGAAQLATVRRHPASGHSLLADTDSPLFALARSAALLHHERWDGTGYPHGLAGSAIPMAARVIAVVDVYGALTATRSYRNALTPAQARRFMAAERGRAFDPGCVDAFLAATDCEVGHSTREPA